MRDGVDDAYAGHVHAVRLPQGDYERDVDQMFADNRNESVWSAKRQKNVNIRAPQFLRIADVMKLN